MATSDLCDVSTPISLTYGPLRVPEDNRRIAVVAENRRYDEWWENGMSSRSPMPIIVNGDFGELGTSNVPNGWTAISSPTITSVTTTGFGNGISMTAAGAGQGIEYEFNVKPCCNYILVLDIKGNCRIQIGRKDACGNFTTIETVDHNPGTGAWIRLPHVAFRTLNFESASTDTTLFIRLLTVNGSDTAQFAQAQLWEGMWPRPFQDFRQGLEGYFKKFTANSFIYAGASGRLTSTAAATNGQLLIGSTGAAPVAATLTGTTNQVNVTNGAGSITLATPQNIHTAATPTFAGLQLTAAASSDSKVGYTAGATEWAAGVDFSDSGAFVISDSATLGTRNTLRIAEQGNFTLTQQVVTSGAPTFVIFNPAASTGLTAGAEVIDMDFALNRTLQRATGAVTTQRAIFVRAPTYGFVGASTITNAATFYIDAAPVAGTNATITNAYAAWFDAGIVRIDGITELNAVRYTWPSADGAASTFLQTNGSGTLSWAAPSGAPTDASYVVMGLNGTLTAERVLTGTSNQITVTDGGAGGNVTLSTPQDIHTTATPQFLRLGLGGAAAAAVTLTCAVSDASTDPQIHAVQASTGDAGIRLAIGTARSYILAIDNNDSDILKISTAASATAVAGTGDLIAITSGGRMGIATISPDDLLHIQGGSAIVSDAQLTLEGYVNGYGAGIDFVSRTSTGGTRVSMAKITADGENSWNTTASTQDANLRFFTTADGTQTERMRIWSSGAVSMGSGLVEFGRCHIKSADNGNPLSLSIDATSANITTADNFVVFRNDAGTAIGDISGTAVSGVLAYNTFTGGHYSQGNVPEGTVPGTVLVSLKEMCEWKDEMNLTLPKCGISDKAKDKAAYGFYGGHDRDGDIIVLALGSGVALACDEGGPIEIGDFLCTSSKAGYVMKYGGNDMRVVLGKAREALLTEEGTIAVTIMAG